MDRFYAQDLPASETDLSQTPDDYELTGEEAHHLVRVLRAKPGTQIELFDGQGRLAQGVVYSTTKLSACIQLTRIWQVPPPSITLTVLTSFPKGERLNVMIEKLCELGVARVVPLLTDRTVVDPGESKLQRLEKNIIAACKQSKRAHLMQLGDAVSIDDVLQSYVSTETRFGIVLDPSACRALLPQLRSVWQSPDVQVAIGPEGGWTREELAMWEHHQWSLARLGTAILRTETAAIAVASMFLAMSESDEDP